jgi:glycosyltransferase involved in cell wall biosynthesis
MLFLKNFFLPKIVFFPWFLSLIVIFFCKIFFRKIKKKEKKYICIEAKEQGWNSIELKELYHSACEFFGKENVCNLVIDSKKNYTDQINEVIKKGITHYVYDPRTGCQNWLIGLFQSFKILIKFQKNNIIPIVILTDLAIRKWRAQAAVVSSANGVVLTLVSSEVVAPIFPHKRLFGPTLMALSKNTKKNINNLIFEKITNSPPKAIFAGSIYEPRGTFVREVEIRVKSRGFHFANYGRQIGSIKEPDINYWKKLAEADIVFTPASQFFQPGADWTHIPHFIYRFSETLISGSLLITENVDGISKFYKDGEHFVSYNSLDDAVEKICFYLSNSELRKKIAHKGKQQADFFVDTQYYWNSVSSKLI